MDSAQEEQSARVDAEQTNWMRIFRSRLSAGHLSTHKIMEEFSRIPTILVRGIAVWPLGARSVQVA